MNKKLSQSETGKKLLKGLKKQKYKLVLFNKTNYSEIDKILKENKINIKLNKLDSLCIKKPYKRIILIRKERNENRNIAKLARELFHLICKNHKIEFDSIYKELIAHYIGEKVFYELTNKEIDVDAITKTVYEQNKQKSKGYYEVIDIVLNKLKIKTVGHDVFERSLRKNKFPVMGCYAYKVFK